MNYDFSLIAVENCKFIHPYNANGEGKLSSCCVGVCHVHLNMTNPLEVSTAWDNLHSWRLHRFELQCYWHAGIFAVELGGHNNIIRIYL